MKPNYSFLVRYKRYGQRKIELIDESVLCGTVQEARRWMMESVQIIERSGGRVVEARTYRSAVSS